MQGPTHCLTIRGAYTHYFTSSLHTSVCRKVTAFQVFKYTWNPVLGHWSDIHEHILLKRSFKSTTCGATEVYCNLSKTEVEINTMEQAKKKKNKTAEVQGDKWTQRRAWQANRKQWIILLKHIMGHVTAVCSLYTWTDCSYIQSSLKHSIKNPSTFVNLENTT